MLKKEVCKQCRIDDYGEEKGWNDFAEAWFESNRHRRGHVFCPPNVTQSVNENLSYTYSTKKGMMIKVEGILVVVKNMKQP